jgi:hypothetical protein
LHDCRFPTSPWVTDHLILFVRLSEEGRRMVSEDSQRLGGFPMIHRLSDLRDLDDSFHREMPTEFHQVDNAYELLEVPPLRSPQWVLSKERDDLGAEVVETVNVVPKEILAVIITSPVPIDPAATEEPNQFLESITTRLSLYDVE